MKSLRIHCPPSKYKTTYTFEEVEDADTLEILAAFNDKQNFVLNYRMRDRLSEYHEPDRYSEYYIRQYVFNCDEVSLIEVWTPPEATDEED